MLSQFGEFKGHIQPKENHNVCQCVQGQTGRYKPVWEEPLLPSLTHNVLLKCYCALRFAGIQGEAGNFLRIFIKSNKKKLHLIVAYK